MKKSPQSNIFFDACGKHFYRYWTLNQNVSLRSPSPIKTPPNRALLCLLILYNKEIVNCSKLKRLNCILTVFVFCLTFILQRLTLVFNFKLWAGKPRYLFIKTQSFSLNHCTVPRGQAVSESPNVFIHFKPIVH